TDKLSKQGVKTVVIVDPGVKYQPPLPAPSPQIPEPVRELDVEQVFVAMRGESARALLQQDQSYYVFNQGFAGNHFQRRKNSDLFIPRVWPCDSVFVDFTRQEARKCWDDLHRPYTDNGLADDWNDLNEAEDSIDESDRT